MKFKALILIALLLVISVLAQENSPNEIKGDEPLHPNTFFYGYGSGSGSGGGGYPGGSGGGGGGGGGAGYTGGFSHGGVYGGGHICKWGCCSESYGYNHPGGGYYSCSCCATAAQAKAYQRSQPKSAQTNN